MSGRSARRPLRILLIAAAAVLLLAGGFLLLSGRMAGGGWTVMVYMIGSDLEAEDGLASRDLKEMQAALRDDTTLLLMAGGTAAWTDSALSADGCGLYRVTRGGIAPIDRHSGSMGSADTLQRLLEAGLAEASGHTALILWDHGYGAMEGFGNDECSEDQRLTLPELAHALQASMPAGKKLSLLGFDACLMACCEAAVSLAPYADYLLASQETEPPDGWDYSFLGKLSPSSDAGQAGRHAVSAYSSHYEALYSSFPQLRQPYTLSLTDLSKIPALSDALQAFLAELHGWISSGRFSELSRLRSAAWAFGRIRTTTEYDLVDLGSFAGRFQQTDPGAQAVLAALNACVAAHEGSEPSASGLSLYFPQQAQAFRRSTWQQAMAGMPLGEGWLACIAAYEAELDSRKPLQALASAAEGYAVTLSDAQLRDFARAKYFVFEEARNGYMRMIYASNAYQLEDHTLSVPYQGQCLMLTTPESRVPLVAFHTQEDGQYAYYQSYVLASGVRDEKASVTRLKLSILFDRQADSWAVLSAIDQSAGLVTGRQEVPVSDFWAVPLLYLPVYDQQGNPLPATQWAQTDSPLDNHVRVDGGYTLALQPLEKKPGCRYCLQIVVVDTHNQEYGSDLFPLLSEGMG